MYGVGFNAIDANYSSWGPALTSTVGLGSEIVVIIISFAILMYIIYKFNIPTEAAIVIGVGMIFAMSINFWSSGDIMRSLIALTMVGIATLIVIAALKFGRK